MNQQLRNLCQILHLVARGTFIHSFAPPTVLIIISITWKVWSIDRRDFSPVECAYALFTGRDNSWRSAGGDESIFPIVLILVCVAYVARNRVIASRTDEERIYRDKEHVLSFLYVSYYFCWILKQL